MSFFEELANQRIEEAIANGLFDDLVGTGKPLNLDDYFATPAHLRATHSMLKSNGYIPPEVELMHEIHALEKQITKAEGRVLTKLERQLIHKQTALAIAMDRIRSQSRNQQATQNLSW
ncbi:DUF1992 domain-containing protein [Rubritalea tangerina]|uniref:DUF1992 domain-containing protein n=1 Tax=Rubritalea tangerina TaxID=430798 RepID=A0ABW4ZDH9_9BACT